jgi:SAM-dependent methyltransferase
VKFTRRTSNALNRFLDQWVPPALRDVGPLRWIVRRSYHELPIEVDVFRDRAFELSPEEFSTFYRSLVSHFDQGDTDLTPVSAEGVLHAVTGTTILDVACGKGWLSSRLARDGARVVGVDLALTTGDRALRYDGFERCEGTIEALPFRDDAFDTVVSTHTLEHVQHFARALTELRRVARQRVVIVVPRQRPYRGALNPHIHFFPYRFSLLAWTGSERPYRCELVGGDWLYVEDQVAPAPAVASVVTR